MPVTDAIVGYGRGVPLQALRLWTATESCGCEEAGAFMSYEHHIYHLERERHCREMAALASDPEVRRRHEELASLHAGRAALYQAGAGAELSVN